MTKPRGTKAAAVRAKRQSAWGERFAAVEDKLRAVAYEFEAYKRLFGPERDTATKSARDLSVHDHLQALARGVAELREALAKVEKRVDDLYAREDRLRSAVVDVDNRNQDEIGYLKERIHKLERGRSW